VLIKLPEPEIPEDGFTRCDPFSRKSTAETLWNISKLADDGLIVALDAPWGFGKSFFLRQFKKYVATQGSACIVFDAFKNDLSDDAFSSIAGELLRELQALKNKPEKTIDKLKSMGAKVGRFAAKGGARLALGYATAGLLNYASIASFLKNNDQDNALEKGIVDISEAATDGVLKAAFSAHADSAENVTSLREILNECVQALQLENSEENEPHLFFIIDELDRCRPSFAIDTIEVVKHLYSAENITFIISADFDQLRASVKQCYGQDIDAHKYLHKFFDILVNFPVKTNQDISIYSAYKSKVISYFDESELTINGVDYVLDSFVHMAESRHISIREFQRMCQYLIISIANGGHFTTFPPVIAALCATKVLNPALYQKLISKRGSVQELIEFFSLDENSEDRESLYLIGCWKFCLFSPSAFQAADDNVTSWGKMGRHHYRENIFPDIAKLCTENLKLP
jgi:hypothetical protein